MRILGDAFVAEFNDAPQFDQRLAGSCENRELSV